MKGGTRMATRNPLAFHGADDLLHHVRESPPHPAAHDRASARHRAPAASPPASPRGSRISRPAPCCGSQAHQERRSLQDGPRQDQAAHPDRRAFHAHDRSAPTPARAGGDRQILRLRASRSPSASAASLSRISFRGVQHGSRRQQHREADAIRLQAVGEHARDIMAKRRGFCRDAGGSSGLFMRRHSCAACGRNPPTVPSRRESCA